MFTPSLVAALALSVVAAVDDPASSTTPAAAPPRPAESAAPPPAESAPPPPAESAPTPAQPAPAVVTAPATPAKAPAANARALPRVYVAPINAADRATARLVGDRVLVAARAYQDAFDVVGAADVQGILDAEAAKAAVGCDSTSCENEIADALNAEQLVTGQLGRIGDTWQLTLTRTERKTLKVLARASTDAKGDSAEVLLDEIPASVAVLFGRAPPRSPVLGLAGTAALVVGGVVAVAGVALYGDSWLQYGIASSQLASGNVVDAGKARDHGVFVLPFGYGAMIAGAAVAAAGGVMLALAPSSSSSSSEEDP